MKSDSLTSDYPIILNIMDGKFNLEIEKLGINVIHPDLLTATTKLDIIKNEKIERLNISNGIINDRGLHYWKYRLMKRLLLASVIFAVIGYSAAMLFLDKEKIIKAKILARQYMTLYYDRAINAIDPEAIINSYYWFTIKDENNGNGTLHIIYDGTRWNGRVYYTKIERWESLEQVSINEKTGKIMFYRPKYQQKHVMKKIDEYLYSGVYHHLKDNVSYSWTAEKIIK